MKRLCPLLLLLFLGLLLAPARPRPSSGASGASTPPPPRPNIVFILADDLGRADCGFMGGKEIKTPRLDKLAASGAILDAFYVQPVCTPTRAALLTGRYPMRHGLQVGVVRPWARYGLPLAERTLPQALRQAGYQTAIAGKWHLGHFERGYLPTARGFEHQYGHYNGAIDYFSHERDGGHDWHRDDRANHDPGYSTHLLAREAVRRIRERDKKQPLFLYVPFNAVHAPLQVPETYTAPYAHLPRQRRLYAGMLAAMDEAVGQILDTLDAEKLTSNTLVVFASDNGGPSPGRVTNNGPLRAGKGTLYEGGVRVVACASWPGRIRAGSTVKAPLHIADWYPTLLNLAGAPLAQPLPLDGHDLWPALTRNAPSPHEAILLNTTPGGGAIRAGDWKLILGGDVRDVEDAESPAAGPRRPRRARGQAVELFNLAHDPNETRNLAGERPDKARELRARLDALAVQAVPPKAAPAPPGHKAPRVWGETEIAPRETK